MSMRPEMPAVDKAGIIRAALFDPIVSTQAGRRSRAMKSGRKHPQGFMRNRSGACGLAVKFSATCYALQMIGGLTGWLLRNFDFQNDYSEVPLCRRTGTVNSKFNLMFKPCAYYVV